MYMPEDVAASIAKEDNNVIILGFRRGIVRNKGISKDNLEPCTWPVAGSNEIGGVYFFERVNGAMWYLWPKQMGLYVRNMNMKSWSALKDKTKQELLDWWRPEEVVTDKNLAR
jgi:hypothetical protein